VQFNRVVPSGAKQKWVLNGLESVPLFLVMWHFGEIL